MPKKPKEPTVVLYLGVFRKITEDGAVWVRNELIDPRTDISVSEFTRAVKKPTHGAWTNIMDPIWDASDMAEGYHLPFQTFEGDDPTDYDFLSMVYPIVLTGKIVGLINAIRDAQETHQGRKVLEMAIQLIECIQGFNDPLLLFYSAVQCQVKNLDIPSLIPPDNCELDLYKLPAPQANSTTI